MARPKRVPVILGKKRDGNLILNATANSTPCHSLAKAVTRVELVLAGCQAGVYFASQLIFRVRQARGNPGNEEIASVTKSKKTRFSVLQTKADPPPYNEYYNLANQVSLFQAALRIV